MDRKEFLTTLGLGIGAAATMSFPTSKEKLPQKNKRINDKWTVDIEELRRGDVVSFEEDLEKLHLYCGGSFDYGHTFRDVETGEVKSIKPYDLEEKKMYLLFHAVENDFQSK